MQWPSPSPDCCDFFNVEEQWSYAVNQTDAQWNELCSSYVIHKSLQASEKKMKNHVVLTFENLDNIISLNGGMILYIFCKKQNDFPTTLNQ